MVGQLPGLDVHWGLGWGIIFCAAMAVLMRHTTQGFALRIVGGNARAARLAGLPVGRLVLFACFLGGAAAGLAGMVEVAAVHGSANASLVAGYGYAGILVAFIARQNPLAIVPVAILLGGISASGGMLQRRLDLPDATVLVSAGRGIPPHPGERDPVRTVQGVPAPVGLTWRAWGSGACRSPCSEARSASARHSSS